MLLLSNSKLFNKPESNSGVPSRTSAAAAPGADAKKALSPLNVARWWLLLLLHMDSKADPAAR